VAAAPAPDGGRSLRRAGAGAGAAGCSDVCKWLGPAGSPREGVIEALRLLSTDAAGAPDSLDAILTRVNISQCAAASECQIAQYILVALLLHCALNRLPSLAQHG